MGTTRRLLGLVLLVLLVGAGGYLLYREHQHQLATREEPEAASAQPSAVTSAEPSAADQAQEPGTGSETADAEQAGSQSTADGTPTATTAPAAGADTTGDTTAAEGAASPGTTASDTPSSTPPAADAGAPDGAGDTTAAATAGAQTDASAADTAGSTEAALAGDGPTSAAPAETISQPEPEAPATQSGSPTFDIVRVEPSGDAVLAGRSEPGMVIALYANGQEIGRTRANASGEWVVALEKPLQPGDYVVTVLGASEDGKRQIESVDRIAVSIPKAKSESPMVAMVSPDAPTKVLQQPDAPAAGAAAVVAAAGEPASSGASASATTTPTADGAPPPPAWTQTLDAGAGTTAATAQPVAPTGGEGSADASAAPASPAAAALAVGVVEKDGDKVTVSGASLPGSKVRIYLDDASIGETTADASGRWSLSAPHDVAAGEHAVRADQIDPGTGAVVARSAVPFDVMSEAEIADTSDTPATLDVTLPPATEAETETAAAPEPAQSDAEQAAETAKSAAPATESAFRKVRIRRGDDLWSLAQRYYGKRNGVRYTAIYRANRKQIRNPDLIYPGQVILVPR